MKKTIILPLFILSILFVKAVSAQTPVTATLKGRVIGQNLEELEGVNISNKRDSTKATSDHRGFFTLKVAANDTLIFTSNKYSSAMYIIKRLTSNINVIMITSKADVLAPDFTTGQFEKAFKEDERIKRILDKGAERNGLWNY
jgi:hypothetical protein